ncbi:MAG: hypothetical protein RR744_10930 [Cellulosilyticaceae bacterium]
MIIIKNVERSDESQEEADVTISDGTYSVMCFSSSFMLKTNDEFKDKIYCFDVEDLCIATKSEPIVEKKDDFYEVFIRGKLEEENSVVYVGELVIDISEAHIPKDICGGDMIEFSSSRLDIY